MNTKHGPNRTNFLAFFLIVLILALVAGGSANAAGFRLIYANDNLGELDGCG